MIMGYVNPTAMFPYIFIMNQYVGQTFVMQYCSALQILQVAYVDHVPFKNQSLHMTQ